MKPVVIVGAGLAGLSCARSLKRARVPFLLIEAEDRIGGRLKTDDTGQYRLDQGYQVYFTAYPHAKDQLDEFKLESKAFAPGASIVWNGEQNLVSRDKPLHLALSGYLTTSDKLRLGRWTSDVKWLDQDDIDRMPDQSTEAYLRQEGFSDEAIDRFFRPFLGGVFLDRSLSTSSRHMLFIWKALAEGQTVLPRLGIEEIPKQIGATLGNEVLRLNAKVSSLLKDQGHVSGVKLVNGETIESDEVILACDAIQAQHLSGVALDLDFRHSITLYFKSSEMPMGSGELVMNGNMRGVTNHIVSMPNAENLLSATILGERPETDTQLAEIVKAEMRLWFPGHDAEEWELIRGYRCINAQMAQPPGRKKVSYDSGIPGLLFAGEFTTNSSIDGAIQSGLECAEFVLDRLGVDAA